MISNRGIRADSRTHPRLAWTVGPNAPKTVQILPGEYHAAPMRPSWLRHRRCQCLRHHGCVRRRGQTHQMVRR
eukprot:5601699-Pyramimonas_sp.AAC.1